MPCFSSRGIRKEVESGWWAWVLCVWCGVFFFKAERQLH